MHLIYNPQRLTLEEHEVIWMPNTNLMSVPSTGSNYSASLDERQDEEVVKLAKDGDEFATEYLISKYKRGNDWPV